VTRGGLSLVPIPPSWPRLDKALHQNAHLCQIRNASNRPKCHTDYNFYEGSNPAPGETLAPQMMTTHHPPGTTVGFPPPDYHFHLPSDSSSSPKTFFNLLNNVSVCCSVAIEHRPSPGDEQRGRNSQRRSYRDRSQRSRGGGELGGANDGEGDAWSCLCLQWHWHTPGGSCCRWQSYTDCSRLAISATSQDCRFPPPASFFRPCGSDRSYSWLLWSVQSLTRSSSIKMGKVSRRCPAKPLPLQEKFSLRGGVTFLL